jgi:hypothetical protein
MFCTMLFSGLDRTFRRTPSVVLQTDSFFDRFGYALRYVLKFPTEHVDTFARNVEINSLCNSLRTQKKTEI